MTILSFTVTAHTSGEICARLPRRSLRRTLLAVASCDCTPHWGDGVGTLRGSSVCASLAPRCRTQITRGRILRPRHPLGCPSLGSVPLPPSRSVAVTETNGRFEIIRGEQLRFTLYNYCFLKDASAIVSNERCSPAAFM